VLFGEDASRIVMSCDPANVERIKQLAEEHGISADLLGETAPGNLEIKVDGHAVVSVAIAGLRDVYENALEQALRAEPVAVAAD
jgi:selenophosphate synthetase-related protein